MTAPLFGQVTRHRFPGLSGTWARLDGPAGSQMVDSAIAAMADWMRSGLGANSHGTFAAAHATDALVDATRTTVARLLGGEPEGIVFGPSTTALTLHFAAAVARSLRPGDEIVLTRLDHDANVRPWLIAAERAGAVVRFAAPEPGTLALGADRIAPLLGPRTRWVAVTAASNACGSVPDLPAIVTAAHAAGARVYVDAVHAVPHRRISRVALGADVIACSSYKWFGPHAGILCADPSLLGVLTPDKLRPSPDTVPERWELGTLPFETVAGIGAAAEYLLALDWDALRAHEDALLERTLAGLEAIPGVSIHGRAADRTPTVMFTVRGRTSTEVAAALAEREIAVWDGNYYALELSAYLGLEPAGAVRAGFLHYNSAAEADRLLDGVAAIARKVP